MAFSGKHNIIGMTGGVNRYSQRPGARGPSSSHGGGLRAPFLCAHQRWGRRGAQERYGTLQRAHRSVQMRSSSSLWQQYSSSAQGRVIQFSVDRLHSPLCQRGARGDLPAVGVPKSPHPPLTKGG
jgi:hypothetical protein